MDVFKTLILDTPDSLENISGVLPVVNGGTGADNASDARDNLGLGTIATQDANAVAITGGSATGLTSLGVVDNTTLGSSNTDTVTFNARAASEFTPATDNTYDLGRVGHEWRDLYLDGTANIDSLVADTADINGGTIDGTTIGATTPANGTFSQVNSTGAIIATGAGSFGDDTDITGDLDVTGAGTFTNSANDAGSVAMLLQNSDGNAGIGSRLGWRLDNLANEWGYINVNRVGGGATAQMDFAVNNAAYTGSPSVAMTVLGSGNVGVGTTAPSTFRTKVLEVADANNAGIVVNGDATNAFASLRLTNSGTSGWDLNYNFPNAGDLGFFDIGAADTRMTLTSAGNVGVGTTAPTAKFVVAGGGAAIQGNGFPSTGAGWEFYTDTTTGSWAQSYSRTSSAWLDANWNALTHKYSTSGAERMRITSGGDVILSGTTMPTVGVTGFGWDNVNEYVRFGKMGAGVQTQAIFISATQTCGSITTNQTTTAYNTSSDYRLKENVVPMSDALQRIGNLKPSRFNFISDDSVVVDGFIAHEVQEVVPEAISGEKDAMREEEYEVTPAVLDDDGNEITPAVMDTRSVPEYQGIDQSKLVPLLVGAIQELTARLEALENN